MGPIIKCKQCKTVIQSKHRHDFVTCQCKSIYVDGGGDYLRVGGNLDDIEILTTTAGDNSLV